MPGYAKDPPAGSGTPDSAGVRLCAEAERLRAFIEDARDKSKELKRKLASIQYRCPQSALFAGLRPCVAERLGARLGQLRCEATAGPFDEESGPLFRGCQRSAGMDGTI